MRLPKGDMLRPTEKVYGETASSIEAMNGRSELSVPETKQTIVIEQASEVNDEPTTSQLGGPVEEVEEDMVDTQAGQYSGQLLRCGVTHPNVGVEATEQVFEAPSVSTDDSQFIPDSEDEYDDDDLLASDERSSDDGKWSTHL